MNYFMEDQTLNMSDFYSSMYPQPAPQQGSTKPRRRRKKNKGDQNIPVVPRKRKLTEVQVNLLELSFGIEHKLESERKERLALEIGLEPVQVAVWFQNRRARWKTQKMEEEYTKLKTDHETAVLEKCRLEMEVLQLKEKLSDAEKEKQMLFKRNDGIYGNSPASPFSMEAMEPQFFGDFGVKEIDNLFYVPQNYINQGIDWVDLYI